jgi:hypothetical protein
MWCKEFCLQGLFPDTLQPTTPVLWLHFDVYCAKFVTPAHQNSPLSRNIIFTVAFRKFFNYCSWFQVCIPVYPSSCFWITISVRLPGLQASPHMATPCVATVLRNLIRSVRVCTRLLQAPCWQLHGRPCRLQGMECDSNIGGRHITFCACSLVLPVAVKSVTTRMC